MSDQENKTPMENNEENDKEKDYISLQIWGKGFLIFSALLIAVFALIFILKGPEKGGSDERMKFEEMLNVDSLEEIERIKQDTFTPVESGNEGN